MVPTIELQPTLSDKEGKDYIEKMKGVYLTIFRYIDTGITQTNAERAEARIWSDMDDEDILVFVEVTIDAAKRSRIVATAVRQVSRAHNLLRLGIITAPRFIQTARFYGDHGGFILPFQGGGSSETTAQ